MTLKTDVWLTVLFTFIFRVIPFKMGMNAFIRGFRSP